MKNILAASLLLCTSWMHAQNILRVNNTPGINAPYTTMAAAIAAAGVNDVIMVEGSLTSYGSLTISKKVTIIGPGYFLDENTGLQASLSSAWFSSIALGGGSDGSLVSGVVIDATGSLTISSSSNITISSIRFHEVVTSISLTGSGTNILIKGNYLNTFVCNGTYTNVIVASNFISGQTVVNAGSLTFSNNIIMANGTSTISNSQVQNNIIMGFVSFSTSTLSHNVLVQGPVAGADGTNIFNANAANLFVGPTGNTTDTQWRLKPGSTAIGAGVGGIDCGIYGGSTPYTPSGISAGQHTITGLAVPATIPQNGTLNIQIGAKVN